ncbi:MULTISPECIES: cache domain-containing protein [unclassified Bacillus (in: firmicutes)]|uniref:cache domain-containing protein n=1 Tax=unclassified Bacillus (in: firmicutes) TaxID=185979 RepID=UPI0008E5850D|nr:MULTISPECIES: cache domain-containing protein [unclassified Bacillus (in: firmicutes)]SFB02663.1 Cache domain-containing protein [Bacillus sp. UNCCL13]
MAKTTKGNKTNKRLSIRVKWILFMCSAIFLALSASVLFNLYTVNGILEKDNMAVNKTNADNAAAQVNLELANYANSLEQLAEITATDIKSADSIARVDQAIHAIQEQNKNLISVYYMDFVSGKLHISPYVEFDKDVRETRTYKDLAKNPKTIWMDVYEDTTAHKIMTSVVTPVMSEGKMVGALGYDIDLSTIGEARTKIENSSKSKLVILDAQGFIVSSFMKEADGKNMNPAKSGTAEGVEDLVSNSTSFKKDLGWIEDIYSSSKNLTHDFSWEGKSYSGQVASIPELNWKVLSFTPDKVFLNKMDQVRNTGIFSILIGLLLGAILAIYLAEKLKKLISNFGSVIDENG